MIKSKSVNKQLELMKQEEEQIKQRRKEETAKYLRFNKTIKAPTISTAEIKLKFDKLANYLDDYKRRLYLSDEVEVKNQFIPKKVKANKRRKAK